MQAAIDVGSNTIRMLVGECYAGSVVSFNSYRDTVRLGGDFSDVTGLSAMSMQRAIATLEIYHNILIEQNISTLRIVGTAALRRAKNCQYFVDQVYAATGFEIEIISGEREACLTAAGVLSVIDSAAESLLIIDIGGGSTELIAIVSNKVRLQKSYPLGVVRLLDEYDNVIERQQQVDLIADQFLMRLNDLNLAHYTWKMIGTAGSITTLAAIDLHLDHYDARLINNHELSTSWLLKLHKKLKVMSVVQREALSGMEPGRGDIIVPGLQILLAFLQQHQLTHLTVADAGLLEGVFLELNGRERCD